MIPADLSWLTSAFPFNNVGIKSALDIRTTITGYLPDANTARTLCDIYFRHASWMCVSLPSYVNPEINAYVQVYPNHRARFF